MNKWSAKNDSSLQFSPLFIYNLGNNAANFGISFAKAYSILENQGAVRFNEFNPSNYLEWCTGTSSMKNALKYRISEYTLKEYSPTSLNTPISSTSSVYLNDMKSLINSGHVLTIATWFYGLDYELLPTQYDSGLTGQWVCIKHNGNTNGCHAMAVVGYDDDIWYDYNKDGIQQSYEKGAFKLANSHGTGYKNDGFVWVMYDALNRQSNCSSQNSSTRTSVFLDYQYNYISVQSYPVDLVAAVTLSQNARKEIKVTLGLSSINTEQPDLLHPTFLNNIGGEYNFLGIQHDVTDATFVFDYYKLAHLPSIRKRYYLMVSDADGDSDTALSKIELIDSTNKKVINEEFSTPQAISGSQEIFSYRLGVVGDVNNDGRVNILDANKISRYLADLAVLSTDDLIVADANGDGKVNAVDATHIQRYLVGLEENLGGGVYVNLE